MKSSTKWFKNAKWGIFLHYLATPDISSREWNKRVDSFKVDKLAEQLAELNAGYMFISLGQNSGHYCSPNSAYDSIVGIRPGKCSRRDLIADLYDALSPKGIKLLVYLPANAPIFDKTALEKLKFTPPWPDRDPLWCGLKAGDITPLPGIDSRMTAFQKNWEAVIREWSLRWKKKVAGWWIDGCYHPDLMYDFPDEPNFKSFTGALKAGNPSAIVAYAVKCGRPWFIIEWDDYTPGEVNGLLPVPAPDKYGKFGGKINGAQYHVLTFMGEGWGMGKPRFSDDFAATWTKEVIKHGGVVTWDVPTTREGLINPSFRKQLKMISSVKQHIT